MSDDQDLTAQDFDPEAQNDAVETPGEMVPIVAEKRGPGRPKRDFFKNSPQKRRLESAVPGAMTLSSSQFSELLAAFKKQASGGNSSPALEAAVAAIQGLQGEVARTVRRSNARSNGISAFSYPEGDYAAAEAGKVKRLTYETYFCGQRQREDDLTPTEVDLFNSFQRSMTCREDRWTATIKQNGTKKQLHIWVPCKTNDDLASLPSLIAVLGELLYGAEVVDPTLTMATIMELQKKVASLEAAAAR